MRAPPLMLLLLAACEPVEPSGKLFTPAPAAPTAGAAAAPAVEAALFDEGPTLVLTSEQMQGTPSDTTLAEAAGVDPGTLPGADAPPADAPAAAPPEAPVALGLPDAVQWPVRLLSTLPQAQPPRAVLGLSTGEERVVSPGSILAEQGLVVMTVTADRVQLARIEAAGDHARIETVELTAQYPSAR